MNLSRRLAFLVSIVAATAALVVPPVVLMSISSLVPGWQGPARCDAVASEITSAPGAQVALVSTPSGIFPISIARGIPQVGHALAVDGGNASVLAITPDGARAFLGDPSLQELAPD